MTTNLMPVPIGLHTIPTSGLEDLKQPSLGNDSLLSSTSDSPGLLLFAFLRTPLSLLEFEFLDLYTPPDDTTFEKHSFTLYFIDTAAYLVDYTIECDAQCHNTALAADLIPEHIIIHLLTDVYNVHLKAALQAALFNVVKQRKPEWQPESIKIHKKIDIARDTQVWWEVEFIMEKCEEARDEKEFVRAHKKVHFDGDGCTTKRDSLHEPDLTLDESEYTFMG